MQSRSRQHQSCLFTRLMWILLFQMTMASVAFAQGGQITLVMQDSTIRSAIHAIARLAKLRPVYNNKIPELSRRIDLKLANASPMEAFSAAFKGTGLIAKLASDGETVVISMPSDETPDTQRRTETETGIIIGRVTDSATGRPLAGVTITIQGIKLNAVTNEKGEFSLRDVPAGDYSVVAKLFSYKVASRVVRVTTGATVTTQFVMIYVATQLSGVVTTATGEQRKIEVGNDITTISVDSIVKTMPVQNMSDLLTTRVPGLYAAPTSGTPGAPTRIRIRGLSSVNASNDPIIIVDGIRVASDQMNRSGNLAVPASNGANFLVSSPLDMIDVNSVETVEVLKGPSAVALYGSDAANGVIVVKTKRGRPGATQWNLNTQIGSETIPGKWPVNYYMWGHNIVDASTPIGCRLELQAQGGCTPDSLVTFQVLNDPARTVLGRGLTQTYRGEVSGGTQTMQYALTGAITNVTGLLKMPKVDQALLEDNGETVPRWQRRPQSDVKRNGTLNVSLNIGPYSVVRFNTMLMNSLTEDSPLKNALSWARGGVPPQQDGGSGLLSGVPNFRTRITAQLVKSTNALELNSTFGTRLQTRLTAGTDVTSRKDVAKLGNGDCFIVSTSCSNTGLYHTGQGMETVTTFNALATAPLNLQNLMSIRTSVGLNYTRARTDDIIRRAEGLPVGATTGNGATTTSGSEQRNDRITAGVYIETVLGIANRWYLPLAIRKDAGSALGSSIAPKFPKLGLSYVASDDQWFSAIPGASYVSMLRLRGAYGQAGVQPIVSQRFRSYEQRSTELDGQVVSYLELASPGNTRLKPERTREYEGGFDVDLFGNRLSTSLSWYRKQTIDLLTSEIVPPSVFLTNQQVNVGDLLNQGFEVAATVIPIEHKYLGMSSRIIFSRNRNRLTRLGSLVGSTGSGVAGGNRYAIGYPLHGYWAQPIVGYTDINGDGIIARTEYVKADSAIYLGAVDPRFSMSWNNTITMFGQFTLGTALQYEDGLTQRRSETTNTIRGYFDPSTPLLVQAVTLYSDLNKVQTVSVLRFQEFSLGYNVPRSITRRIVPGRTARVSLQARNVGLWTNYRGKDPKVNSGMTEVNEDEGVIPQPRRWQLSVGIN